MILIDEMTLFDEILLNDKMTLFNEMPLSNEMYCDQPIISETTRCESVDFIEKIDDQDKMFCAFMFYV